MISRHDAAARTSVSRHRRLATATAALVLLAALGACSGSDGDSDRTPTRAEIATVLARHGAALREHREAEFVAGATGSFRSRQRAVFTSLADVPLSTWSYELGPQVQDSGAQRTARSKHGESALIVRVTLRYALRGVDTEPTSHFLYWTFVRTDTGAVVAVADGDAATVGGQTWRGPWDFGPLRVASGRSSLVLAHPADADLLPTLVADADRAVPTVTSVVGTQWARRVAVIVPGSAAERDADLQSAGTDGAEIGAVTTADSTDPVTGTVLGQRVVVVPDQFRTLTPIAARLVLQHEITHVATARRTTEASPTWLVEGFADYVGYLGNERPVRTAAAALVAQVRRAGAPDALPTSTAFASATSSAAAYELSWLACRRIAAQHGQAALVRFYDAVGTATVPSDQAVVQAAEQVLHETPAQFGARLRSYVTEQLR